MLKNQKNLIIICKYIFEMASSNKFYSEMYANLYKTLMGEFEEMGKSLKLILTFRLHHLSLDLLSERDGRFLANSGR